MSARFSLAKTADVDGPHLDTHGCKTVRKGLLQSCFELILIDGDARCGIRRVCKEGTNGNDGCFADKGVQLTVIGADMFDEFDGSIWRDFIAHSESSDFDFKSRLSLGQRSQTDGFE